MRRFGRQEELITSGASMTWHDLVLYLIGRDVGPVAAQAVSKFFALQRHVGHKLLADQVGLGRPHRGDVHLVAADHGDGGLLRP